MADANVNKLEKFVKVCETAAIALIPNLLTNNGVSGNYTVIILPICVYIIEILKSLILAPEIITGININHAGKNGYTNQYYTYVSWYVANHVKSVNRTFNRYSYHDDHTSDRYIDTGSGTYKVDYMGQVITVICTVKTENGGEYRSLSLKHHNNDLLSKFVFHCQEKYDERFKHDICMYTYSTRHWSGTTILNNKTPDYLFISQSLHNKIFIDAAKFVKSEAYYKQHCIAWKRGYLFYGAPGCGKTSSIMALAQLLRRSIYRINARECDSNNAFEVMCRSIPKESIVSLEDIDSLGSVETRYKYSATREAAVKFAKYRNEAHGRDGNDFDDNDLDLIDILCGESEGKEQRTSYWYSFPIDHLGCRLRDCSDKQQALCRQMDEQWPDFKNYIKKVVSTSKADTISLDTILNVLDGNTYFYGCIIIITTNAVERLDPAVTRSGRIEVKCEFTPADAGIIRDMYRKYCDRELDLEIPEGVKITQSGLVNDVFVANNMEPDVCAEALKTMIERYHTPPNAT